jgi:EamA-like transporter family.
MLKLLSLSFIQCLFLTGSQIFLKMAMSSFGKFSFTWKFFGNLLTNWKLAASGVCIVVATLLWVYILKHFDFSMAYPMISISYVLGMLAAVFIFNETVPMTRWIGVSLIILGVILVARQ